MSGVSNAIYEPKSTTMKDKKLNNEAVSKHLRPNSVQASQKTDIVSKESKTETSPPAGKDVETIESCEKKVVTKHEGNDDDDDDDDEMNDFIEIDDVVSNDRDSQAEYSASETDTEDEEEDEEEDNELMTESFTKDPVQTDDDAQSRSESSFLNDMEGISEENIVVGKRKRVPPKRYEMEVFSSVEYKRMMLCDIPPDEIDAALVDDMSESGSDIESVDDPYDDEND